MIVYDDDENEMETSTSSSHRGNNDHANLTELTSSSSSSSRLNQRRRRRRRRSRSASSSQNQNQHPQQEEEEDERLPQHDLLLDIILEDEESSTHVQSSCRFNGSGQIILNEQQQTARGQQHSPSSILQRQKVHNNTTTPMKNNIIINHTKSRHDDKVKRYKSFLAGLVLICTCFGYYQRHVLLPYSKKNIFTMVSTTTFRRNKMTYFQRRRQHYLLQQQQQHPSNKGSYNYHVAARIFDIKQERSEGHIVWKTEVIQKKKKRYIIVDEQDDNNVAVELERRQILTSDDLNRVYDQDQEDEMMYDSYQRTTIKGLFNNQIADVQNATACVPMQSWQTSLHITCNTFHEIDMTVTADITRLGVGGWRDAWNYISSSSQEEVILKTLWGQKSHLYDPQSYEMHRIDSVVSERLTPLRNVIDIYGYCGQSVLNEKAQTTLEDLMEGKSSQKFTLKQRVQMSRDIAQAISDIHGIDHVDAQHVIFHLKPNATIVHRDLKADNIVFSSDQTLKINDFNSAVLLMYDVNRHKRCRIKKWWKLPWFDALKPPEIFPFGEKADILALGGLLFYTYTEGHYPYMMETHGNKTLIYQLYRDQVTPNLPYDFIIENPKVHKQFMSIIQDCLNPRSLQRPNAYNIATRLNQLLLSFDDDKTKKNKKKKITKVAQTKKRDLTRKKKNTPPQRKN